MYSQRIVICQFQPVSSYQKAFALEIQSAFNFIVLKWILLFSDMKAINSIVILFLFLCGCGEEKIQKSIQSDVTYDQGVQCDSEGSPATFHPADTVDSMRFQIAIYIDLIYGAPRYSEKINLDEIAYVGEYDVCETLIRIWEYECGDTDGCYVGTMPTLNSYSIGTVSPEFNL